MERIREDGYSKPLLDSTKRWKTVKWSMELAKNHYDHAYLSFFNHDGLCWYPEGVVEKSSDVFLQVDLEGVVEVNVESRQLLSVNGENVSGIEHKAMLNLSDEGERWEGDVLNNQPYGWGVLYDKEGEKAYEGFRIGDESVCYGTQYYADIGVIEYEGEWCEGKRWGRGIQYDRNGVVVFDGEWLNDGQMEKRMVMSDEAQLLHCSIEELTVSDNSCNTQGWTLFDPSLLSKLRDLRVGNNCFTKVTEVNLTEMHQLENVVIGNDCFKCIMLDATVRTRAFYLKDCEKLRKLVMGSNSFLDYSVCEIANVNALEEIEMKEANFISTVTFELKGA